MKRTALKRTPPPRPTEAERIERQQWLVGMEPVCAMVGHGPCSGRIEGHHVLAQAVLRKHDLGAHVWDRRNRMPLCAGPSGHHPRHTSRLQPVPLSLVPGEAVEFAHLHGLLWRLERDYGAA